MNPALLFLLVLSARGRVVRALRLLRQPKYIIGVIGFMAWMGIATMGVWMDWVRGEEVGVRFGAIGVLAELAPDVVTAVQLMVALALTLAFSVWWLVPWGSSSLDLKEEELHILMPAPVKRRHLIQYAVLRSQPGVLFGCLMMTVFLGGGGPAGRLLWFVGVWLMLTNWDLHAKGRALWNAKQDELPPRWALARRLLLVGAIVAFWIAVGVVVTALVGEAMAWRPPPDAEGDAVVRAALAELGPLVSESLLGWLLLPFVWVTEPLFVAPAASSGTVLWSWAAPGLLLAVQNEWVVRSQARFEEAALAHARKKAQEADATSRYWKTSLRLRRKVPFPLAPVGPPEVAVWWKNVMQIHRWPVSHSVAVGALACLAVGAAPPLLGAPGWIYGLVFGISVFLLLGAPVFFAQSLRNDLRMDLLKFEVVRPWPMRGWRLVAAQVAGPATLAMLVSLLGAGLLLAVDLAVTLANVRLDGNDDVMVMQRLAAFMGVPHVVAVPLLLLTLLPILVAMTTLSAALANLATLVFPGWVQLGPRANNQGAAAMGQNIVIFFGLGLALLLATLPAVLLVGVIVAVQIFLMDVPVTGWELPVLGLVAATPIGVAAALAIRGAGGLWERLDPSSEILEA